VLQHVRTALMGRLEDMLYVVMHTNMGQMVLWCFVKGLITDSSPSWTFPMPCVQQIQMVYNTMRTLT